MEGIREVKKSFCVLSVAYIVLGLVLLLWPDISVKTFCYVFGVGLVIFGLAHLILYFTKDKMESVMQMDMVAGIVGLATGAFILLKMEYMLEIIPFAIGIVALLGAVVKLQNAFDLRRLGAGKWYIMLIFSCALFVLGALLVANPFEGMQVIVVLIGVSLMLDGIGNLIGIFWIGHAFKHLKKMAQSTDRYDVAEVYDGSADVEDIPAEAEDVSAEVIVSGGEK
ncbi:MAG: DUF308 domain-containing protein [Eubacteriales bacterium]|nr:DUF308 domain-containing protein [Eubacteriales bacterium]